MEDFEKIGRAKGKADSSNIFLDKFLRVDSDDFAAGIEQRAATVAGRGHEQYNEQKNSAGLA